MTKYTVGVLAILHAMFQQLNIAVLPQKDLKDLPRYSSHASGSLGIPLTFWFGYSQH